MRKIWYGIIVVALIFILKGCVVREWEERHVNYHAPNWTSDGKIIFFEEIWIQKLRESISGPEIIEETQSLTLYEVDNNGTNYEEIEEVSSSARGFFSMVGSSSAGDHVVFGLSNIGNNENEIWVIERDGSELREVGEGRYPDFSPDASQIVYEKTNNGIWIMNRDGGNDRQIIADVDARFPAWSPDGEGVAYVIGYPNVHTLVMVDTSGVMLNGFSVEIDMPDWGPADSNAISGSGGAYARIIYCDSGNTNNLSDVPAGWGGGAKWSPEGIYFIGYTSGEYWITDRHSGNRWNLEL